MSLFIERNTAVYFDLFRIKYILREELRNIKDKSTTHIMFRIQSDGSIMSGWILLYRFYRTYDCKKNLVIL